MISTELGEMRKYFESGATRSLDFRKQQLQKLKASLLKYERELHDALYLDLKKSPEESWVTETGFLLSEINATIKNLRQWMQPRKTATTLVNFPSTSYFIKDPLGVVLIIGPWNYPLQLLFTPMVGAIAAGNCVVLKPSEFCPATTSVMQKMIAENFERNYISFVEGEGSKVVPEMIGSFRFNHIFYTGSTAIGKLVYKMAADQLVPVTLELGGKSPCIVEADANISVAAKRIAMTKFSNAGQMCVAPDYVLVHSSIKEKFLEALTEKIQQFFGKDASVSHEYGKIINEKQFNRLIAYLGSGNLIYGGKHDLQSLYIEPTVIDNVSMDKMIMKEEIFGPILPVLSFDSYEEAQSIIKQNPDPLAFYVFTSDSEKQNRWIRNTTFGGACINNASWHLTNHFLPFGGRGNSGIGRYHGQYSFDTFSHEKSVMKTPTWFDPAIKYPPFKGKMRLFKLIIR